MNWWENRPHNETHHRRHSGRPSISEITPHLLIGEYPQPEDAAWLKNEYGVTAVHSLQDDDDLRGKGLNMEELRRAFHAQGIKFARTAIQDGSADAMAERLEPALRELRALIADGNRVYLHCNAGLNRAPTLAIAYLRAYEGMSLDEAVAYVKQRRACGPFMTILEDYFGPRHIKPES